MKNASWIEIHSVPPRAHKVITTAIGQDRVRYSPRTETLAIPRRLRDVSWTQYDALLRALPDHRMRHTYDRGTLEMMSPSTKHEWIKGFVGRLLETMAYELAIPIKTVGSTTRRSKAAQQGLEPDESYYVANERLMRDRFDDDPDRDPPPDLVIEVDMRRASVKRKRIYASLGVREVWQHDGKELQFYQLAANGKYLSIGESVSFPFLQPKDLDHFIDRKGTVEENELVRGFVELARTKLKKKSGSRRIKKKKGP